MVSGLQIDNKIKNYCVRQRAGEVLPCPRCGGKMRDNFTYNSLSRRADIYICRQCGMIEALEDMCKANNPDFVKLPIEDWSFMKNVFIA